VGEHIIGLPTTAVVSVRVSSSTPPGIRVCVCARKQCVLVVASASLPDSACDSECASVNNLRLGLHLYLYRARVWCTLSMGGSYIYMYIYTCTYMYMFKYYTYTYI